MFLQFEQYIAAPLTDWLFFILENWVFCTNKEAVSTLIEVFAFGFIIVIVSSVTHFSVLVT